MDGLSKESATWLSLTKLIACLCCLVIGTSSLTSCSSKQTRFSAAGNELNATLTLPETSQGPVPVVIFVHGDGAANVDYYGYYQSFWKALADIGVASFSWDKPGVGKSNGNWLDQDMDDRAAEVIAAASYLTQRPEIDAQNIGVIGFSQAGWVLPRLANEDWLSYLVFASTAVSWIEQSDFLFKRRWASRAQLDLEGYRNAIERNRRTDAVLFDHDADYADFLDVVAQYEGPDASKPMSRARFAFVKRNINEDASENLKKIQVPVLALFGEDDLNIDVDDSLSVYAKIFNASAAIDYKSRLFPGANHQLAKSSIFNQVQPGWWSAIAINFLGDDVFVDGVLDELTGFVVAQGGRHER